MMREERGSMVPMMGALLFVGFTIIALAVDVALLHGAYLRASVVADHAAEAAAAMIDVDAAHAGETVLDTRAATAIAVRVLIDNGWQGSSEVGFDGAQVCVEVSEPHGTVALAFVGLPTVQVATVACAVPAVG